MRRAPPSDRYIGQYNTWYVPVLITRFDDHQGPRAGLNAGLVRPPLGGIPLRQSVIPRSWVPSKDSAQRGLEHVEHEGNGVIWSTDDQKRRVIRPCATIPPTVL